MPAGGQLMLATRREGDMAVVQVIETGHGMAEDVLKRIFEPYFSTKKSGVGLGLPTARRIVEQHGGTMEVASESGRGTQFTIRLPISTAALEDEARERS
jgi:signal transduction histidine kinase